MVKSNIGLARRARLGCTACVASALVKQRHGTTCYGMQYWEPGGCSSDRTIVRLNVDTGVVWCFPRFSAVLLYPTSISSRVTLTKCHAIRLPLATDDIGTTTGQ
jgi:hypothetical protein